MQRFQISGVPIVDGDGRLVGIITNRDLQFERNLDRPLREAMTQENLVTAPVGTDARRGRADPRQASHREAAGRRRGRACSRASSRSRTSSSGASIPTRTRTSTAACALPRRSARAGRPSRAPARWSTPASMCSSSIRRTATAMACWATLDPSGEAFPDVQLVAGNVATEPAPARWSSAASTR